MKRRRDFIWILALLMAGCGARMVPVRGSLPYNWGGGVGRSHQAATAITPPLTRIWATGCEAAVGRTLASDGQRVFVGLQNGKFDVLDLASGRRLRRKKAGLAGEVTILASQERLWVALRHGTPALQGWDLSGAKARWKTDLDETAVAGEPLLLNDGVALLGELGDVRVFSAEGDCIAQRALNTPCWAGPSASGSAMFCVAHDGRLWALSRYDAGVLWSALLSGRVTASPTVAGGRLFLGSLDGRLHAFDAATGALLWQTDLGGGLFETVSALGDTVYAGTARGLIAALSAQDGHVIWCLETGSALGTSIVLSGSTCYLGLLDGRLLALNRETGEERWSARLKGRIRTTPLVVGSWLVVASEGLTIYGFRDENR